MISFVLTGLKISLSLIHMDFQEDWAMTQDEFTTVLDEYFAAKTEEEVEVHPLAQGTKSLTMLFVDIKGYDKLSGLLKEQKIKDFCQIFTEIAAQYEGIVIGCYDHGILMLFGAAITHEDDPVRSVNAGLDIMTALQRFNEESRTEFSTSIGINAGRVSITKIDGTYKITGAPIDFVKQLSKRAENEILMSAAIQKRVSHLFKMRKVKITGSKAYRIVSIKETPGKKHGFAEFGAPLVDRDREFAVMKLTLDKVMTGKGAVISVVGDAGVGKSRLIEEFREVTKDKVTWLSGRCPSYGQTFPYWVFLEQIRSFLGVTEFDLEPDSRQKLDAKAASLFKTKMNEYLPYLSVFLSIKVLENLQEKVKYLDPEALRLQEFVSIKALFRDIAKPKPLILYFEDMHWIDPESLELLKFLLDGLKDAPILFLFETRPEKDSGLFRIQDSLQKTFGGNSKVVTLKTLSQDDGKILIQNLLKSPKAQRISSIILEKSEGNPFYIEEMLRSLIERGILIYKSDIPDPAPQVSAGRGRARSGAGWHLTSGISTMEIPDTIEAVIKSRIDRLPIETKEVLGRASVIGKSFPYKILDYISEKNHLEKRLNFLENNGFISEKKYIPLTSHSSGDSEYMFRHILIRDVVYHGLTKDLRREIHKRIAECVENIFQERTRDYYELIAYHYHQAAELHKAYDYYRKAGDEARTRYQISAALAGYSKAIELHNKLHAKNSREQLAELYDRRGDMYEVKARYTQTLKDYEKAFYYYRDRERRGEIKRKEANIYFRKSGFAKAISRYKMAIKILAGIPESATRWSTLVNYAFLLADGKSDYRNAQRILNRTIARVDKDKTPGLYASCLDTMAVILREKGDHRRALDYYKKALAIHKNGNNKRGLGCMLCSIGNVYWSSGYYDKAMIYYKNSLKIAEEIGDKKNIDIACCNIGSALHGRGELSASLEYTMRSLMISEQLGDTMGIAIVANNIGNIYHDMGEIATALRYCRRAFELAEKLGAKDELGLACSNIGRLYIEMSNYHGARKYLIRAARVLSEIDNKTHVSEVYTHLSELSVLKGDHRLGSRFAKKALRLAQKTGAKWHEAAALRSLAKAQPAASPKAISYLKQSIAVAKKQGMQIEIAKSFYELARILQNAGRFDKTEKYLKEAEKIFRKSGCHGWIEKIRRIKR